MIRRRGEGPGGGGQVSDPCCDRTVAITTFVRRSHLGRIGHVVVSQNRGTPI